MADYSESKLEMVSESGSDGGGGGGGGHNIAEGIKKYVKWPVDVIVVDNGNGAAVVGALQC